MNGAHVLGGVPVGDVGEDQLRLVDSIHELLSEVERERAREKRALETCGEKVRSLEATNAALERRLAGKREMEGESLLVARERASGSQGAVSNGGDEGLDDDAAANDDDEGSDASSRDEDAWSDDDDGSTPSRRRGFFASLNPFARR